MKHMPPLKTIQINAAGISLGRLSSRVAGHLLGKRSTQYASNRIISPLIIVTNARQVRLTGNKENTKTYTRYSGYPGGLKKAQLRERIEKDPINPIRDAIYGMLPSNRLRNERMKRVRIYRDEVK